MGLRRIMLALYGAIVLAEGGSPSAARDRLNDPYKIMAPEPGMVTSRQPLRGLQERPNTTRTQPLAPSARPRVADPPPSITLPNGQVVPSVPPVNRGMVPGGGGETFGDRAARCAHQSGLYGVPGDQRHNYIHACAQ